MNCDRNLRQNIIIIFVICLILIIIDFDLKSEIAQNSHNNMILMVRKYETLQIKEEKKSIFVIKMNSFFYRCDSNTSDNLLI